ncbi:hypothetical protein KKI95_14600 [Xenorhabdus bovienii]|uniref:hypothetical protein n=1 Tax=Xenorhabdus bovienii TaxID=40576 RepID=UPI0023B227A6|nr:hypothetical protein [Xenorhabdus bovienii]MDE9437125.1 hypothetical protein [Xenorhabdus bovienii]MDE9499816.1 hypothetical protein [Xenorhabdus bovienii]
MANYYKSHNNQQKLAVIAYHNATLRALTRHFRGFFHWTPINLRIMELAHQAHLSEQPENFMAAAQIRYELIQQMAIDTEFSPLVARIELMNRRLAHGLAMNIEKGISNLLLPKHICPNSGKEGTASLYTRLYTPFRNHNFFPDFRSQWMAGINN